VPPRRCTSRSTPRAMLSATTCSNRSARQPSSVSLDGARRSSSATPQGRSPTRIVSPAPLWRHPSPRLHELRSPAADVRHQLQLARRRTRRVTPLRQHRSEPVRMPSQRPAHPLLQPQLHPVPCGTGRSSMVSIRHIAAKSGRSLQRNGARPPPTVPTSPSTMSVTRSVPPANTTARPTTRRASQPRFLSTPPHSKHAPNIHWR
jgi:hypothetical protein